MLRELDIKDTQIEPIVNKALKDGAVLMELMDGLLVKKEIRRHNCFRALLEISEKQPDVLLPEWDFFVGQLDSKNTFHKYDAIYILANLTLIDKESRFKRIFTKYFGLLKDKSVIPAAHVARNAGKIARANPELEPQITDMLINIGRFRPDPKYNDLIKGYAIESFDEYVKISREKERICEFVRNQLTSTSPRTQKIARQFLEKWDKI